MVLIETVVTGFVDEFPSLGLSKWVRFLTTLSVCVVFFLSGVSMTTQVRRGARDTRRDAQSLGSTAGGGEAAVVRGGAVAPGGTLTSLIFCGA